MMAEGTPYREIPFPAAPPGESRRVIDRCLAGSNGVLLVPLVLGAMERARCLSACLATFEVTFANYLAQLVWVALPPVLAVIGFIGYRARAERAWLTLPSGLQWLIGGVTTGTRASVIQGYGALLHGLHRHHYELPQERMVASLRDPAWVIVGVVFIVIGALTIESTVTRIRAARARPLAA